MPTRMGWRGASGSVGRGGLAILTKLPRQFVMNSRPDGHACEARGFLGSDENEKGVSCGRVPRDSFLVRWKPKPKLPRAF